MAEQTDEWHISHRYMAVETLAKVINRNLEEAQLLENQAVAREPVNGDR
ncbi:MAG: hypothetical protein ACODAC_06590 [Pseudomonadota bacterium]